MSVSLIVIWHIPSNGIISRIHDFTELESVYAYINVIKIYK